MSLYLNPVIHSGFSGAPKKAMFVDVQIPAVWELVSISLLLLFYIVAQLAFGEDAYALANIVGPISLAVLLFAGAARMLSINSFALWLGLFTFRMMTALYFGIGSIVQLFFNLETLLQWRMFFAAEPADLFKVNLIVALSVWIVFFTATAFCWFVRARPVEVVRRKSDRILLICALMFSLLGYATKYFLQIPLFIRFLPENAVPGFFIQLSQLTPVGLFLLTLWCNRYQPRYMFIPSFLMVAEVSTGLMLFSKAEVLKPIIVYMMALIQDKITRVRLASIAAVLIVVFNTIVPITSFGRGELDARYNDFRNGSLQERFEIILLYFSGDGWANAGGDSQTNIARLSYSNSAAAAVELYDSGRPGSSMQDVFTVLIPRFLWPDKPIFNYGERFNEMLNGSRRSSSWMGLFAEAYWNYSWLGLPIMMIPLALMFVLIGRATLMIMSRSMWLHFPVVLLGVYMGARVDGQFALEMFAPACICLVGYYVASAADGFVRPFLSGMPEDSRS